MTLLLYERTRDAQTAMCFIFAVYIIHNVYIIEILDCLLFALDPVANIDQDEESLFWFPLEIWAMLDRDRNFDLQYISHMF